MKNKGPNLTLEILSKLTTSQIIETLIKKAGVIEYERLVSVLYSAC